MIDAQSDLAIAHEAIDESLAELSQVGIAIRNSSKTTEASRARRFAATSLDLTVLEALVFLAVETLFPSAPESLQAQLGQSMVDRHLRLLYRASQHNILKTDCRKQGAGLEQPLVNVGAKTPIAEHGQSGPRATNQDFSSFFPAPSTFALTSFDSKDFREKQHTPRLPKSRAGTTTTVLGATHEPAIPNFEGNQSATCRWCFASIPDSYVENGRWTAAGR
jgi:hypothetical protein